MTQFKISQMLKSVTLAGAALSLSGCMYGAGAGYSDGYYGDGYVNGGYANAVRGGYNCDPYSPFNDYYACDSGYGFANIGFGGGWYDHHYYPGYGRYIFDRHGSRHAMKKHHRRHWAQKRAHHGTRHHATRGKGHGNHDGYRGNDRHRGDNGAHHQRRRGQHGETVRGNRRGGSEQGAADNRGRRDGGAVRNSRRPTIAAQQPQARPTQSQPTQARQAAPPRPAAAARRAQTGADRPRNSRRSSHVDRSNTHIE